MGPVTSGVAVGRRGASQGTQVSSLSLVKVTVATAQPEGADHCKCLAEPA